MTQRAIAQRLQALSVEVEIQLQARTGAAPLAHHLKRSRERMLEALYALADVDATETETIRKLQMDVRMHDRLLEDLREIVAKGFEAGDYLDHEAAADIALAVGLTQGDEGTTPNEEPYAD
jgi:hypothetical protein